MRRPLALAGMLAALPAACARERESVPEERVQVMEGLSLAQSDRGARAWTLRARRSELREDARVARLEAPFMEFYEEGKPVSRVTALAGEVGVETHDVRLSSGVVLESYEDHSRLMTDSLLYSSERRRFFTDAGVEIRRPEGVVRGRGLEATPDLSEIRIREHRSTITEAPQ